MSQGRKKSVLHLCLILIFLNIEESNYTAALVLTHDGRSQLQQATSIQLPWLDRFTVSQPSRLLHKLCDQNDTFKNK